MLMLFINWYTIYPSISRFFKNQNKFPRYKMVKRIAKEVQIFHHLHQRRIEEETPKENDYRKKKSQFGVCY